MQRKKPSFAFLFTTLCLSISLLGISIIATVSIMSLRTVSSAQIKALVSENILRIHEDLTGMLDRYEVLLQTTATGVTTMLRSGSPSRNDMFKYLEHTATTLPGISVLYYGSNYLWSLPGGYIVYSLDFTPPETWDQTQRPWFILAKQARGNIAYSELYLDPLTGSLVLTLSKTMVSSDGQDMGVVA